MTQGPFDLKHTSIISDPVHGYIHLTELEREIINTKIFLRLQNIKQSATAVFTYPSHTVDRFTHSPGSMELIGKIVASALKNSGDTTLRKFFSRHQVICP
jgi:HD superfamily phosphohydrolase